MNKGSLVKWRGLIGQIGVILEAMPRTHDKLYVYWFNGYKRGWVHKHWLEVV